MNCPYCQYHDSKVVDSRDVSDGIRRRRECLACGSRFTTYERLQHAGLYVIKKDQRREEFNKDKLLAGIRKACEKRPLPTGTIDRIADDIETGIYSLGKAEIPSSLIGDMVMERLKKLDYIAYIRFASVYRQFTDITALKQEIESLMSNEDKSASLTSQLPLIPEEEFEAAGAKHRRIRR
jgi:transcriptional repressor NrdR